ncbi:MAG: anti-sigma regulatory factor [Clostridia bacterium]|nr:anti-sigma regulatory factor [Clostridia bacterium]MDD4048064.1 anti-sigma regulatory factor [Clostridia bacterium]
MRDNIVKPMVMSYFVEKGNFTCAGEASSKIKNKLMKLGFPSSLIRRVAIATYEAEMNLVIHSWGGVIKAEIKPDVVCISITDTGPGIPNIDKAMQEGYSTAPESIREMGFGAGMGLPNMRNCADTFNIESQKGKGTTIKMIIR